MVDQNWICLTSREEWQIKRNGVDSGLSKVDFLCHDRRQWAGSERKAPNCLQQRFKKKPTVLTISALRVLAKMQKDL